MIRLNLLDDGLWHSPHFPNKWLATAGEISRKVTNIGEAALKNSGLFLEVDPIFRNLPFYLIKSK